MKVVILCGGMGTRLREETEYKPKPMVEIGSRPILWHIMKSYAAHGFTDFILCLGYKGEKIKEYFLNYKAMNSDFTVTLGKHGVVELNDDHAEDGWRVTLADTGLKALTGARVRRIQKYVGNEPFLLTYGDGVSDVDLTQLVAFHQKQGRLATLTGVRAPGRFGELGLEGDQVTTFHEKPEVSGGYINGGFFILEPGVFNYLSDDDSCILEREPLEKLASAAQLNVFKHDGFWQCIDTFRDVTLVNQLWDSGKAPWKSWK
jgi:glucose-1-phosphate cytidylyltransferase